MKYLYNFLIRYLLLFIPISLIYFIFSPITIYGSYYLIYFLKPSIIGNIITVNGIPFTFIDACIAAYAYYLIWFLSLTAKDVKIKTRVKLILIGFLLILLMNYFRISLLIYLTVKYGIDAFNIVHMFFWKFLSWFYVALVWIILVKFYRVKSIPLYDDFKYLWKKSLFKKK